MEQDNNIKLMKTITGILDILICLLLFISSLYKGAFYKEDGLFVNVVICMLGLVCLSVKLVLNIRDNRKITKSKLGTIVDISVMLMPVAYFTPIAFGKAASMESAIFETLRYVNFAIIYFIVRTTSNKKVYLTSIVLIGVILAVLGIDEMTYRAIESIVSPISINYLSGNGGKLSSTIQYANITALIMLMASIIVQDKISKNLPNLNYKSNIKFKALVALELFGLIILQSAIILTTSRMNLILMIITTIIYAIYCLKRNKNKSALGLILMLIASLSLVTSIDSYLLVKNNFMIIFTYFITFILIIIGVTLGTKFIVAKGSKEIHYNPKRIVMQCGVVLSAVFVIFVVCTTPNSLRLNDTTKQGTSISRNIYTNIQDSIKLDIEFKFNRNYNFEFHVYEVDAEFNKQILVSLTKDSLTDGEYHGKLNISEKAESMLIEFKTIDSDVSIKQFKVNDKSITLSYMFIPDSIMFRLKDTLIKDSNNMLRFTYYKDALKLFNTSKLFGIGGEGFKARYQQVQEDNYISSEVHSAPLQILVESGIFGGVCFILICVSTCIIVYRLFKIKNEETLLYLLMLFTFVITSAFDLVFSFGIMIYLFAVIVGLIIGEYKQGDILDSDRYELDNKSTLGMVKIATLSISLMALVIATVYSINIFRASMIIIPKQYETLENSYNRVGLLETKVALDKYNIANLSNLMEQYDTHIDMLNTIYLSSKDDDERRVFKTEINNYIVKQKEVADSMIECEYYNKYALEKIARCYFDNYISYANIFNNNFKNDDIAYVFYIGYAIKITDRLTEVGKVNNLARNFAKNIYEEYIPILEKQNSLIKSEMLASAIQDMKNKLEILK